MNFIKARKACSKDFAVLDGPPIYDRGYAGASSFALPIYNKIDF